MPTRTVAQHRDEERREFESFLAQCPSRDLLGTLGSKWVTLVLAALGHGALRYNEILRRIAGISPKMLTQTLRTIERDGLATRTVTPTVPVTVEYRLTPLGNDLLAIILDLKTWAETHVRIIQTARQAYDHPPRNA
ncbi:winged helix-turn-helix transcriptional regulator [Luethyella okanaganae]|uniref:Winged helix-turn-helix transcriptional regulator n=1 Tax=Luethyella okanaganae TaxID=69372 RepID=A0ABW1VHF6_9MICO